jgi:uroporphyrinogen III methyltransferase/synthase
MVTRAAAQSTELTARIEALGASVIHCPTIEIIEPSDYRPLDSAIDRLESFDWIAFTSSNAAKFFCDRLVARHPDGAMAILSLVTCAIGPATAKALEAAEVEVDVLARDSTSEGVLAAIIEYAGSATSLAGVRFLIPRARQARELLPEELGRFGAIVETVEAYQTVKPDIDGTRIVRILEKGLDVVTFTSPSTVMNFVTLTGVKDLSKLLNKTFVACIGPVTAATAREHGLKNLIEPETHTSSALAEAIARALVSRRH